MEGEEGQVKGKQKLATSGTKASVRSDYVNLSEYPPGTDIEYELHWDGTRVTCRVPRWAHEKWLLNSQNAGGQEEDHPNSASSGPKAAPRCPREDLVKNSSATCGIERPRVGHPRSASATAAAASSSSAPKARNRLPKVPPETAAAYAEVIGMKPELIHAFPDAYAYHVYPGRYGHYVEGRRIVAKLEKWAGFTYVPYKVPKPEVGFFVPKHDMIHQQVSRSKVMCRQPQAN